MKGIHITTRIILERDQQYIEQLRLFSPKSKIYKQTAEAYEQFLNLQWNMIEIEVKE